jgi:hypothetical protein
LDGLDGRFTERNVAGKRQDLTVIAQVRVRGKADLHVVKVMKSPLLKVEHRNLVPAVDGDDRRYERAFAPASPSPG